MFEQLLPVLVTCSLQLDVLLERSINTLALLAPQAVLMHLNL